MAAWVRGWGKRYGPGVRPSPSNASGRGASAAAFLLPPSPLTPRLTGGAFTAVLAALEPSGCERPFPRGRGPLALRPSRAARAPIGPIVPSAFAAPPWTLGAVAPKSPVGPSGTALRRGSTALPTVIRRGIYDLPGGTSSAPCEALLPGP